MSENQSINTKTYEDAMAYSEKAPTKKEIMKSAAFVALGAAAVVASALVGMECLMETPQILNMISSPEFGMFVGGISGVLGLLNMSKGFGIKRHIESVQNWQEKEKAENRNLTPSELAEKKEKAGARILAIREENKKFDKAADDLGKTIVAGVVISSML